MDMRNLFLAVGLVVLALVSCVKKDIQAPEPVVTLKNAAIQPGYNMVPNEILIKFKDGVNENSKSGVLGKITGKHKEKILTKAMGNAGDKQGINLVSIPGTVDDALAAVKDLPEVEYAEPNYIYTIQVTSNDTYYMNGSLWGMYGTGTTPANQFGSQAGMAWAAGHTGSDDVYVGIIDEGYMYSHVELAENAGKNPGEIQDGIDNDENGYIDDIYGWDFVSNDNTVFDGLGDDHGTHIAGIIGAVGGNGKGVAGVCWHVKLLSAKFFSDDNGGTTANAIKAVDYFTDLKTRKNNPVNVVATNNSWSGGGFSKALKDAIERANKADILFIASAGNGKFGGIDTQSNPIYPSGYTNDNVIAVASINSNGELSAFSNYAQKNVDLAAPGENIWSCVPMLYDNQIQSGLNTYDGTSMASAFVTGAAALYASTHHNAKAFKIKAAILDGAIKTNSLMGKCKTNGRLDVSGF